MDLLHRLAGRDGRRCSCRTSGPGVAGRMGIGEADAAAELQHPASDVRVDQRLSERRVRTHEYKVYDSVMQAFSGHGCPAGRSRRRARPRNSCATSSATSRRPSPPRRRSRPPSTRASSGAPGGQHLRHLHARRRHRLPVARRRARTRRSWASSPEARPPALSAVSPQHPRPRPTASLTFNFGPGDQEFGGLVRVRSSAPTWLDRRALR